MHNLLRYYHFLRHIRIHQITSRFIGKIKKPMTLKLLMLLSNDDIKVSSQFQQTFIRKDISKSLSNSSELLNNTFTFLNKSKSFDNVIIWYGSTYGPLWDFNLNYFNYLAELVDAQRTTNDLIYIEKGHAVINDWIEHSYKYNRTLWSPYTVSVRLINFIKFYNFIKYKKNVSEVQRDRLMSSIVKQYHYLRFNKEKDIEGNHLFENYKALIFTAIFLEKDKHLQKHMNHLKKVLKHQILDDGVHYEKAISYHLIVLDGLLDIIKWLRIVHCEIDDDLKTICKNMYTFFENIKTNEYEYPLFGDSNYTLSQSFIGDLQDKYNTLIGNMASNSDVGQKFISFEKSGYYVLKKNQSSIIFDAGKIGQDNLIAHGHNDILNLVLIYNNNKIISDSGVSDYHDLNWRTFARSTKAHNTVCVNNIEQSDIWSKFRVGYRPNKIYSSQYTDKAQNKIQGAYQYKRMIKSRMNYIHKRTIVQDTNVSMAVLDYVESNNVNNIHKSFIHLHPRIQIAVQKNNSVEILSDQDRLYIHFFGIEDYEIKRGQTIPLQGWFMPEFGVKVARHTIELNITSKDQDAFFGYIISKYAYKNIYANSLEKTVTLKHEDEYQTLELKL